MDDLTGIRTASIIVANDNNYHLGFCKKTEAFTPMRFLCPTHEEWYSLQPEEELVNNWMHWMHLSGCYYQNSQWNRALPYIGSSFDLARLLLSRQGEERKTAITLLTLSGIYLSNVFHHMGDEVESNKVLNIACEYLARFSEPATNSSVMQCMSCLTDTRAHDMFVAHHLNMPLARRSSSQATH
ncbi:hypothetical protein HCH_03971 [Hahella chejuensis KCTC 2396]|uniref:Uncharacterized protein n=2 Tax=Hahella chejuensis TaxID=158327 RepID=Q2SF84_HAHCH|nr:hypothetical protein HCH_03971 [Hahella chejuensis KCTC 2396]